MTIKNDKIQNKGELAYWVGKDYWGNDYATEAALKVVHYGFEGFNLNRIWAGQ